LVLSQTSSVQVFWFFALHSKFELHWLVPYLECGVYTSTEECSVMVSWAQFVHLVMAELVTRMFLFPVEPCWSPFQFERISMFHSASAAAPARSAMKMAVLSVVREVGLLGD
jgi:hypothetical protein